MNILFAGSPKSSSRILESLANLKSVNIMGVLTKPDKRGKRGSKLHESEVAKTAAQFNLKVFKPESINEVDFKASIQCLNIDLIVVVAYGKLIPNWLLSFPKIMCLNIHFSLLPKYRGASPIQSSLLNGDSETGISFMQMTERLDEGGLISSKSISIEDVDNKISVEERLTDLAIENMESVFDMLKNKNAIIINQDNSKASYCKKILKEDSITDFNDSAINILNKFKAYFEWPGLSFIFKGIEIKIHEILITDQKSAGAFGTIDKVSKSGLYLNTSDFIIVITYLQFPNKQKISSLDVFNSYKSFFS
jgi:methionyl-tRNA formyltransferase